MTTHGMRIILALLVTAASVGADDWPRYRGPDGLGISAETGWRPKAVASPKVLWTVRVGDGYSSMAVVKDSLYTMGHADGNDVVTCLDTASGKTRWTHTYACGTGRYGGPRATPTVDGDLVYTVSREGHVFALETESGKVRWHLELPSAFGAERPRWGFAGSAVVRGEALLLNACQHGVKLNKTNGRALWRSPEGTGGYATPVVLDVGGVPAVAVFAEKDVIVADLDTGDVLSSGSWKTRWLVNAADPVALEDNTLLVTSGYKRGCARLDVSHPKTRVVWETDELSAQFSNPVCIDGFVYAIHGQAGSRGSLKCLSLADGRRAWVKDMDFGSLISAGGRLLVLLQDGTLVVAEVNPGEYREIARGRIMKPAGKDQCWTSPALADGRLYARDSGGQLVCVDLR